MCNFLIELREKLKEQIIIDLISESNYLEQRDRQIRIKDINFFLNLPRDLIRKENKKSQTPKG